MAISDAELGGRGWYSMRPVYLDDKDRSLWRRAPLQHREEHEHLAMPITVQVLKDSPDNSD